MKRIKGVAVIFAFVFLFALIKNPEKSSYFIKSGLFYFYSVIIPSLFPITFTTAFIMALLKDTFKKYKYGNIVLIFLFSQIGGYIIGAKLISDGVKSGGITKKQGEIMSLFCVGGGLGFLYTALGVKTLNSKAAGIILLLSNILYGGILFLILFPKLKTDVTKATPQPEKTTALIFCDCVFETTSVMIKIGGFIVLFSALNACVPEKLGVISYFTEIMSAVTTTSNLPFLAFLTGFGGLSVICQISSLLNGIFNIKFFLLSRLLNGLFCFCFAFAAVKIFGIAVPVINMAKGITAAPFSDRISVSVAAVISIIMLILSLESKNRGGNIAEDLLK